MNPYLLTANLVEIITAILATLYFYKYKNTSLKILVFYFWYVVFQEFAAYHLLNKGIIQYELANLYLIVTIIIFLYLIGIEVVLKKLKNITTILIFSIIAIGFFELMSIGVDEPFIITEITSSAFALAGVVIYCIHLFNYSLVFTLSKKLFTYILLGFTLYFVSVPVIKFARINYTDSLDLATQLSYISVFVVILMYSIFCFGFIYCDKQEVNNQNLY